MAANPPKPAFIVSRGRAIRSIVVFRALQLGDMLCAVPTLRALRLGFPRARITLVGLPWAEQFAARFHRYVDVFAAFPGHPDLPEQPVRGEAADGFFENMRACRFDLAVQLHGNGLVSNSIVEALGAAHSVGFRPADEASDGAAANALNYIAYPTVGHEAVRLLALAQHLGLPDAGMRLEFPLHEADYAELDASGLEPGLTPGAYICVHPGARSRDKCWPAQHFAEVADRLADETGLAVVLTGSEKERDMTAAVAARMRHTPVDAAAPISIGAMAALMSRARLLICNDTGVSHIADGLGLPSVVIFSRSEMARWAPIDTSLHASIWDPEGRSVSAVLQHARRLLTVDTRAADAATQRQALHGDSFFGVP